MVDATAVLAAVLAVTAAALLWARHRQSYWTKHGVPTPPGRLPLLGHMAPILLGRKSFGDHFLDMATRHRDLGYCGLYMWNQPALLVFDPQMVQQVVCKDFAKFHDRAPAPAPAEEDPLSQHLFSMTGSKWRNLRNRLSPTFTSGKLKLMFPLMRDISDQLSVTVASEVEKSGGEVDVQALLTRYVTDVIGSVAFGIDCNCLANENVEFLTMAQGVFRQSPGQTVRALLETIHPRLGRLLPLWLLFNKVHHFFMNLMRETVEHRDKNKIVRNDFVHLMMQLRDQDLGHSDPDNHVAMTTGMMAAQAFIFFVAGLDTVSNTAAFCLHQLVLDADLQQRVADEVRDAIQKHDGQLTYAALKDMKLLNRVMLEGLRLWTPVSPIFRRCNKTATVGDVLVEAGTPVFIVTETLHKNPAIFPDPDRFDPERHTAEAREQLHPYAFIPFGEGPRICIGERFAMLEMKLALATMLRDFKFSRGPRFEVRPAQDPGSFIRRAANGFPLRIEVRT